MTSKTDIHALGSIGVILSKKEIRKVKFYLFFGMTKSAQKVMLSAVKKWNEERK